MYDGINPNLFLEPNGKSHTTKIFICDDCEENFAAAYELRVHQESIHMKVGNYECRICNTKFSYIEKLTNHVEDTHLNTLTNVVEEYDLDDVDILHIEDEIDPNSTLKAVSGEMFECDVCEESFENQVKLESHTSTIHNFYNKCNICHVELNNLKELNDHFEVAHSNDENPERENSQVEEINESNDKKSGLGRKKLKNCTYCMKKFVNRQALVSHIACIHKKEKNFKCEKCDKSFGQLTSKQRHFQNIHQGIKKFECKDCQISYAQKTQLDNHLFNVHTSVENSQAQSNKTVKEPEYDAEKRKSCKICTKTFSSDNTLRIHITTVHKKERNFKCEKCGKAFGQRGSLKSHIKNIHEGIKSYKCKECSAAFSSLMLHNLHFMKAHHM